MSQPVNTFTIKKITFPNIQAVVLGGPLDENYNINFRVEGLISSDKIFTLLFGVNVFSSEKMAEKPKVNIIIESLIEFEYETPLEKYTRFSDFPNAANLLAIVYPFLREKIHYCLASNEIRYLVPPMNMMKLVSDRKDDPTFKIEDKR